MEWSRAVPLWISVIGTLISNDQNGLYGSEIHHLPPGQVPNSGLQNAVPGTVSGAATRFSTDGLASYPLGTGPGAALGATSGYPASFQHGYPASGQHQGFPPNGVQGFHQPGVHGFPPGSVPGYAPISALSHAPGGYYPQGFMMHGINLRDPLVFETLKAISKVTELSISARKLRNRDVHSLSDPFCITYLRPFNARPDAWVEFHKSETVKDNLDPDFWKKPLIPPSFGDKYSIMFKIFDSDLNSRTHDVLGYAECNLKELLSKDVMILDLRTTKTYSSREITSRNSKIIVGVEHLEDNNSEVHIQFNGSNIEKKDRKLGFKRNSDPYVEVRKNIVGGDSSSLVYRTEIREKDLSPAWLEFTVPVKSLNNGNDDRLLQFVCKDWDPKKTHDLIGSFSISLAQLRLKFQHGEILDFHNMASSRPNKVGGNLHVTKLETIQKPTFTEFIERGLKFHVNIAIDFSDANGSLLSPSSLHFQHQDGNNKNKYEQAISTVVEILQAYDYNKTFQVLGFGAQTGKTGSPNDAFQVNPESPECVGTKGVWDAYRKYLSKPEVKLSSPVNFAPVLRKFVQNIKTSAPSQDDFFIILILTAGVINDLVETEAVIRNASLLPISIIIVGIGEATGTKFDNMERLDGDHLQKTISGVRTSRDIVQFVPLSKFVTSFVDSGASLALAKELLAELPDQVITYMKLNSFKPRNVYGQAQPIYGGYPPMAPYGNVMGGMMPQAVSTNMSGFYGQPQGVPGGPAFGAPASYMQQTSMMQSAQAQMQTSPGFNVQHR